MKKLFCIIGKTGAGKTTLLNSLMRNGISEYGVERLVYSTTRPPRFNEVNGIDYNFISNDTFEELLEKDELIEYRQYYTENNGMVFYFTDKKSLSKDVNYICAPSIEQLKSYIDILGPDSIYIIYVKCPVDIRFRRVAEKRAKSEDDFYELCRRVIQERIDWKIADNILAGIHPDHIMGTDNNLDVENFDMLYHDAKAWIEVKALR